MNTVITVEDASALRAALIQGHDAVSVAAASLERAIASIERSYPELRPTGRIDPPTDDDEWDSEPFDDLSDGANDTLSDALTTALKGLQNVRPAVPLTPFDLSTAQLRALIERYGGEEETVQ